MTQPIPGTAAWWNRLEQLATVGPDPDDYEAAERFIAEAERMTNAARALIDPGAVSPAKARLMRYPITPKTT
jgi:hypothetical protein